MSQSQNDETGCVCKNPGWCDRHKCYKNEKFHHLCQHNLKYFNSWENGTGPGQRVLAEEDLEYFDVIVETPGIVQKGVNFGRAVVRHVRTGMNHCSEEERAARFKICQSNECGFFIVDGDGGVCGHKSCGCYLRHNGRFMDKLSWAESECPVGMWLAIEPEKQENS